MAKKKASRKKSGKSSRKKSTVKSAKMMSSSKGGACCSTTAGSHAMGFKLLILGILMMFNSYFLNADWYMFFAVIFVILGLVKMIWPKVGHP
jgi:hypothetical protein